MYNKIKITVVNEITNNSKTEVADFTTEATLIQLTILRLMQDDISKEKKITLGQESKSRFVNGTHQNISAFLDNDEMKERLFYTAIWLPQHSDVPYSVKLTKKKPTPPF